MMDLLFNGVGWTDIALTLNRIAVGTFVQAGVSLEDEVGRIGLDDRGAGLPHPGHLMPNMQGDAADAVDGVLRAAINKRSKDVG
jgi:hypothetical protein